MYVRESSLFYFHIELYSGYIEKKYDSCAVISIWTYTNRLSYESTELRIDTVTNMDFRFGLEINNSAIFFNTLFYRYPNYHSDVMYFINHHVALLLCNFYHKIALVHRFKNKSGLHFLLWHPVEVVLYFVDRC